MTSPPMEAINEAFKSARTQAVARAEKKVQEKDIKDCTSLSPTYISGAMCGDDLKERHDTIWHKYVSMMPVSFVSLN